MIKVDIIVNYFMALLIPKLIFKFLIVTSQYTGMYAISSRLKDLSFDIGMKEGIGVLVFIGILIYNISNRLIYEYYHRKINIERKQNKLLTEDVLKRIDSYLISKPLKQKLTSAYILQIYY